MEAPTATTPPIRCTQCQQPMESPIACLTCGALSQRPPETFDCFELFGLPRRYDVDEPWLHRKYLALSRAVHPDMVPVECGSRDQALGLSAEFNRAYETLRDPVARAEYLLSLAGGPGPGEDRSVPPELLGQVLVLREEIEEATVTRDVDALRSLRRQVESEREAGLAEIAALARDLDDGDEEKRGRLRRRLNTIKYWNNLLEGLPARAGLGGEPTR